MQAGDGSPSPAIARRLINPVAGDPGTATPREQQVAAAIAQGSSNGDIAAALRMSLATVKARVSRLLAKLQADNRAQIALLVQDATRPPHYR